MCAAGGRAGRVTLLSPLESSQFHHEFKIQEMKFRIWCFPWWSLFFSPDQFLLGSKFSFWKENVYYVSSPTVWKKNVYYVSPHIRST